MMMSANATRTSTATRINASLEDEEWNHIFPIKVAQSYTSSIKFMKQLTTIAFSTITFLKHMFPEENYTHHNFMGINLKILKEKCEDELAQCATTALINSFDALDKKYLEKLVLCVYEGEQHPDNLVESYAMSFTYKPAGVVLERGGRVGPAAEADARERTKNLLQACVLYATESPQLRPDAASYGITIRLYYNENAPAGYQAPGFSSAREGGVEAALQGASRFTCVRTPHHSARLLIYHSPRDGDTNVSTRTIPSFSQQKLDDIRDVIWDQAPAQAPVQCECGLEDEAELMLTCSGCSARQHAACYGERGTAPAGAHYCVPCGRAGSGPLCASLAKYIDQERTLRGLCMYRRVLWCCSTRTHVSSGALCDALGLGGALGARLLHELHRARVILQSDGIQKIDHEKLKVEIDTHFRPEDDSVVERLVAESQSQGEVDPVLEALRPAERSTLRAAAGAAPLLPRAPPQPIVQDSTLEQYRKAVCFTDDIEDDLPLSGKHNPVPTIDQTEKKVAKRKPDSEKPLLKSRLSTKRSKLMMAQKNKKT